MPWQRQDTANVVLASQCPLTKTLSIEVTRRTCKRSWIQHCKCVRQLPLRLKANECIDFIKCERENYWQSYERFILTINAKYEHNP